MEAVSGMAMLSNVVRVLQALEHARSAAPHLPKLLCLYGHSGHGKTSAAAVAAVQERAYHIEVRSTWTRRALLEAILREMGVAADGRTLYGMQSQICEQLALSRRPLIIDEADHVVQRGMIELVRDLHEDSGGVILLIGEEMLPAKLRRYERVHNRVLEWINAAPATMEDARLLRQLYCRGVTIQDDLLAAIHKASTGVTRRVCVNLEMVQEQLRNKGRKDGDLAWWGEREFYTGAPPARRGAA